MATIHDFSKKISQIFPWNPIICLKVVEQDIHAYDKISSVERIVLVPTL